MYRRPSRALGAIALAGLVSSSLAASLIDYCPYDPVAVVKPEPHPQCVLPVDDETWGQVKGTPWTQKPLCIASRKNEDDKFCTFIAPFNDRPISLITRVNTASMLSAGITHPEQKFLSRKHLNGTFAGPINEPAYKVDFIEGKGWGLTAMRKIGKGELILVDYPVLLAHVNFGTLLSEKDAGTLLRSAFGGMSAEVQREVRDLAMSTYGGIWEDVLRTNGFIVEPGGFQHIGLFVEASRINHNCLPNAYARFSQQTYSMEVFALKDIKRGEEIEISYTAIGAPTWARHKSLTNRGFTCTCHLCSSRPSVLRESDRRRERLQEIKGILQLSPPQGSAAVDLMNEAMEIIEDEDLDLLLAEFYELFSHVYAGMGSFAHAKEYASLAGEWALMMRGRDDDFRERIGRFVYELGKLAGEEEGEHGHAHDHHHEHEHEHEEAKTEQVVTPFKAADDITGDGPKETGNTS